MKFEILSDPNNMKVVRNKLKNFIKKNHFKNININEIILATDEAVQNVIRHAYNMEKKHLIKFNFADDKYSALLVNQSNCSKQVNPIG